MIKDPWIKTYWRPAMAWQYMIVCIFDFIIFPLITMALTKITGSYIKWEPLTLKESGFYHISMSAIVGVSAWTRGQEKITRITASEVKSIETKEPIPESQPLKGE